MDWRALSSPACRLSTFRVYRLLCRHLARTCIGRCNLRCSRTSFLQPARQRTGWICQQPQRTMPTCSQSWNGCRPLWHSHSTHRFPPTSPPPASHRPCCTRQRQHRLRRVACCDCTHGEYTVSKHAYTVTLHTARLHAALPRASGTVKVPSTQT